MEDPYASIIAQCFISDSQCEILGDPKPIPRDCLGVSSPSDPSPSAPSPAGAIPGIVICSPPDVPRATPPDSVPRPVTLASSSTTVDPPPDPRVRRMIGLIKSFWDGREDAEDPEPRMSPSIARGVGTSGGCVNGSALKVANELLGLSRDRVSAEEGGSALESREERGLPPSIVDKEGSAWGSKGERRLPPLIVDKKEERPKRKHAEARPSGLADLMGFLFDEADRSIGDVDILELSMKAGLTFPLPKWRKL